jgi:hypothetical protein
VVKKQEEGREGERREEERREEEKEIGRGESRSEE